MKVEGHCYRCVSCGTLRPFPRQYTLENSHDIVEQLRQRARSFRTVHVASSQEEWRRVLEAFQREQPEP